MTSTDPSPTTMTNQQRQQIARDAAAGLRQFADSAPQSPVLVGFDGFVDSIIDVVDKRPSMETYEKLPTIAAFHEKVQASIGQSCNFELVSKLEKLGGNGPIMANAFAHFGLPVTYIGCLGSEGQIHPVFQDFAKNATVYSIADPGYTDALEFEDGKLMFGKHGNLRHVNYDRLCQQLGEENFTRTVSRCSLVGMVNWTMLPELESIWQALTERVLPGLTQQEQTPILFVDLADPAKRTDDDIHRALDRIAEMNHFTGVVLGLNLKESTRIARVLGLTPPEEPEASIQETTYAIREKLGLFGTVIHPRRGAAASVLDERGQVRTGRFEGPFIRRPYLSTGAGDNFNAGFCLGLIADLPVSQALCVGTATSGYYVRNGQSPTLPQLADLCDALPAPEP